MNTCMTDRDVFGLPIPGDEDEVAATFKAFVQKRTFQTKYNRFVNFKWENVDNDFSKDCSVTYEP